MEEYSKSIDFAGARGAFGELTRFLEGAGALDHDELEAAVAERGREVARRALQDLLDHRARTEERSVSVLGRDGVERRRVESSSRRLDTTDAGSTLCVDPRCQRGGGGGRRDPRSGPRPGPRLPCPPRLPKLGSGVPL